MLLIVFTFFSSIAFANEKTESILISIVDDSEYISTLSPEDANTINRNDELNELLSEFLIERLFNDGRFDIVVPTFVKEEKLDSIFHNISKPQYVIYAYISNLKTEDRILDNGLVIAKAKVEIKFHIIDTKTGQNILTIVDKGKGKSESGLKVFAIHKALYRAANSSSMKFIKQFCEKDRR